MLCSTFLRVIPAESSGKLNITPTWISCYISRGVVRSELNLIPYIYKKKKSKMFKDLNVIFKIIKSL